MQNYVKMYERVEFAANHDELTGLLNRRSFNRYLSEIDGNTAASLLLIDIDYFKMINDTYGHITGDMILKKFQIHLKMSLLKMLQLDGLAAKNLQLF